MEQIDSLVWGFGIGLFFLGIAVGIALSRFNDKYWRQTQTLEREMHNMSNDFHAYRAQVTDHFIGSAKLLNKLTEDYRNIYHHLAVSSESLVGAHISDVLEFKNTVIVDDLIPVKESKKAQPEKTSRIRVEAKKPVEEATVTTNTAANKAVEPKPNANKDDAAIKAGKAAAAKTKATPKINLAKEDSAKKPAARKKTTRKPTSKKAAEVTTEDSQLIRTLELVKEQVLEKVEEEKSKAKRGRPRKTTTASDAEDKTTVRKATKRPKKEEVELENLSPEDELGKEKIA